MMDDIVGEMMTYLKGRGLYDDTVICYSTDHGDMMGSHGLWEKGYPMLYEETNKIPLVVGVPGYTGSVSTDGVADSIADGVADSIADGIADSIASGLMSVTDILPTLADLAGCPFDTAGLDIKSFADGTQSRDFHIAEAFEIDGGYRGTNRPGGIPTRAEDLCPIKDRAAVAVKTERYKYIFHTHDRDELYDLLEDSGENINLAGNPCMVDICGGLRGIMLDAISDNPPFHAFIANIIANDIQNRDR